MNKPMGIPPPTSVRIAKAGVVAAEAGFVIVEGRICRDVDPRGCDPLAGHVILAAEERVGIADRRLYDVDRGNEQPGHVSADEPAVIKHLRGGSDTPALAFDRPFPVVDTMTAGKFQQRAAVELDIEIDTAGRSPEDGLGYVAFQRAELNDRCHGETISSCRLDS